MPEKLETTPLVLAGPRPGPGPSPTGSVRALAVTAPVHARAHVSIVPLRVFRTRVYGPPRACQ